MKLKSTFQPRTCRYIDYEWYCLRNYPTLNGYIINNGCGRTKMSDFTETWLKFLEILTRWKVGYDETTGIYFLNGHTEMGCEMGELDIGGRGGGKPKICRLRGPRCYFLVSFLSPAHYANFQGSSFDRDVNLPWMSEYSSLPSVESPLILDLSEKSVTAWGKH